MTGNQIFFLCLAGIVALVFLSVAWIEHLDKKNERGGYEK